MKRLLLLFAIASVFVLFGCLESSSSAYSCCVSADALGTKKVCVLDDAAGIDYVSHFCKPDDNGVITKCNITVTKATGKTQDVTVPLCGTRPPLGCIQPQCVAMVCGDFVYHPKPLPGMPTQEELDNSEEMVPLKEETQDVAINLYKADCKMMPLDEDLNNIMKRTGAVTNNFRIGVGATFADNEKFRYLLPVSDRFCGINQQGTVDRYMNYYQYCLARPKGLASIGACGAASMEKALKYDPVQAINKSECMLEGGVAGRLSDNYPFLVTPTGTIGYEGTTSDILGFKINKAFYANSLVASWRDQIYNDFKKAPFECLTTECLSGYCSKDTYKRGVAVKKDGKEVPVDCYVEFDMGRRVIACLPVESVTRDGNQINYKFNDVQLYPTNYLIDADAMDTAYIGKDVAKLLGPTRSQGWAHLQFMATDITSYCTGEVGDKGEDFCRGGNDRGWESGTAMLGSKHTAYNLPESKYVTLSTMPNFIGASRGSPITVSDKDTCIDGSSPTSDKFCFYGSASGNKEYPSAGSIYFFGRDDVVFKLNQRNGEMPKSDSNPNGNPEQYTRIIGYIVGGPNIDNLELVKNCNIKSYIRIDTWGDSAIVYNSDGIRTSLNEGKARMLNTFQPLLLDAAKAAQTGLGKDEAVSDFDIFAAGSPWIVAYKKDVRTDFTSADIGSSPYPKSKYVGDVIVTGAPYRIFERRNVFGKTEPSSDLAVLEPRQWKEIEYSAGGSDSFIPTTMLISRYVYLLNDTGDCELDWDMPRIKEYGWCEPCTYLTMAQDYMSPLSNNDPAYSGGPPKWEQSALLYQTAFDNYLKNGVFTIIDLRSYSGTGAAYSLEQMLGGKDGFTVSGNSGALTVIVKDADQAARIKSKCPHCLVADKALDSDWLSSTYTPPSWADIVIMQYNVNKETTDNVGLGCLFSTECHKYASAKDYWLSLSPSAQATLIINQMALAGKKITQKSCSGTSCPKPIIIDYYISKDDYFPYSDTNPKTSVYYGQLFGEMFRQKDTLRKSGIMGLQYSIFYNPFGTPGTPLPGIPLADSYVITGKPAQKFCGFQVGGNNAVISTSLTQLQTVRAVSLKDNQTIDDMTGQLRCVPCTKDGGCDGTTDLNCLDGTICKLDNKLDKTKQQCPAGLISPNCPLCSSWAGYINVTYKNASSGGEYNKSYSISSLTEADGEIISLMPQKCCFNDATGNRTTFSMSKVPLVSNLPVVYSKTGDQLQDCGVLDPAILGGTSVCGVNLKKDEVVKVGFVEARHPSCFDSDGGVEPMLSGITRAIYSDGSYAGTNIVERPDECGLNDVLMEYSCAVGGGISTTTVNCRSLNCGFNPLEKCACVDSRAGAKCALRPAGQKLPAGTCVDNDADLGDLAITIASSAMDSSMNSPAFDECASDTVLREVSCRKRQGQSEPDLHAMTDSIDCKAAGYDKCWNGACIKTPATGCYDADAALIPSGDDAFTPSFAYNYGGYVPDTQQPVKDPSRRPDILIEMRCQNGKLVENLINCSQTRPGYTCQQTSGSGSGVPDPNMNVAYCGK